MRNECFDMPDRLFALVERQAVNRSRHRLEAEFAGYPSDGFRAGLKRVDAIAPDLARDQRLESVVQAALRIAQRAVGETSQRHVPCAARVDADPRLTRCAEP